MGTNHNILRKHLTPNGRLLTIAFPNRENLTHLARLVDNGDIVTNIDSVYPIDEIVKAHKRAEQRGILGKIVVDIAGQGNLKSNKK